VQAIHTATGSRLVAPRQGKIDQNKLKKDGTTLRGGGGWIF
jgi:hypothetical protein